MREPAVAIDRAVADDAVPSDDVLHRSAAFRPDPATCRRANRRMADEMIESVAAMAAALGREAPRPGRERDEMPSPMAFARYFDLLGAVIADDLEAAHAALDEVGTALAERAWPAVAPWSSFTDDERSCLLRHVNDDPSTRVVLTDPAPEISRQTEAAIVAAMALLADTAPDLADEIRAVVRQVILVSGTVNVVETFDGATSFSVIGGLFLNADRHPNRIAAVDGLSHESAHAVLFSHSNGRPFVENPDDERHASPLRADLRPLDGTFHATFVSARMHYAFRTVLDADALRPDEMAPAQEALAASRVAFEDGRATLLRHARLTPDGRRLLDAASAYMDSVRAAG